MSTTDASTGSATQQPGKATLATRIEMIVLPVADAERSKQFYEGLGWRLDADFPGPDGYRVIQLTPPGSSASVAFGSGVTNAEPGSVESILLVVDDIDAARDDLIARGVDVSEAFHDSGGSLGGGFIADAGSRAPGHDPEHRSYATYARFSDPDGNGFLLQEVTERLPGRVDAKGGADLAALLRETSEHHGRYEEAAEPHDWWDWYAAYFHARQAGATPQEADAAADRFMEETHGVAIVNP